MNVSIAPKRKLEASESWELPWVCWALVKDKYSQVLAVSLILVVAYLPFAFIPVVGNAIGNFVLTIIVYGVIKLCRTWDHGGDIIISDMFVGITDPKQRERIFPLAGVLAACTLVTSLLTLGVSLLSKGSLWATGMTLPLTLGFAILQSALNYFSISLVAFHQNIEWKEALHISFNTYFSNFIPLALVGIVILAIAVVSALCFVLPLFFFFIPLSLPVVYFLYKAVFEGVELKAGD